MTSLNLWLAHPAARALGWTVLHFLWQGALAAAMLGVVLAILPRRAANARYIASCITLAAMLVVAIGTYARQARDERPVTSYRAPVAPATHVVAPVAKSPSILPVVTTPVRTPKPLRPEFPSAALRAWVSGRLGLLAPWCAAAWLLGVCLLSMRVLGGWWWTRRVRNDAAIEDPSLTDVFERLRARMGITAAVRVLRSARVHAPVLVGVLKPMVIVPAAGMSGLAPLQLESLLAHELAHLHRNDPILNLLQTGVETLLFFHPAVWWVSGRIREEREHCCDDMAVRACGDALVYARALATLEQARAGAPAMALGASGGRLLSRIVRLVQKPASPARGSQWMAGVVGLGSVVALVAALGVTPDAHGTPATRHLRKLMRAAVAAADKTCPPCPACPENKCKDKSAAACVAKGCDKSADVSASDVTVPPEATAALAALPAQMAALAADLAQLAPAVYDESQLRAGAGQAQQLACKEQAEAAKEAAEDAQDQAADAADTDAETRAIAREVARGNARAYLWNGNDKSMPPQTRQLIQTFREHGIDMEYLRSLRPLRRGLRPEEVIALHDHGVTGENLAAYRSLASDLSTEEIVSLQDHGVSPEFTAGMQWLGIRSIPTIISLHDHGVDHEYVAALRVSGYKNLPWEQLVMLHDNGVGATYISEMSALGVAAQPRELVRLYQNGVGPRYVAELKGLGYDHMQVEDLIRLVANGVSTSYVSQIAEAGMSGLTTEQLVRLSANGVPADFVRKAMRTGKNPSVDDVIRWNSNGEIPQD